MDTKTPSFLRPKPTPVLATSSTFNNDSVKLPPMLPNQGMQSPMKPKIAVDIELFAQGFVDGLKKVADVPMINTQKQWKISRTRNLWKLWDGSKLIQFQAPNGTSIVSAFPLIAVPNAEGDTFTGTGTVNSLQIHTATPIFLHFTIQDGDKNPTYMLNQVREEHWRATPKRKEKKAEVSEEQLEKLALDIGKGLVSAIHKGTNLFMQPGLDPLKAMGVGAAAGAAFDLGKRVLYNTPEENQREGLGTTALRVAAPALALGALGAGQKTLFGDTYYRAYPMFQK